MQMHLLFIFKIFQTFDSYKKPYCFTKLICFSTFDTSNKNHG